MSRLHSLRVPIEEVARHFLATPAGGITAPEETIEGQSGVAIYEANGRRRIRLMRWGFPRLTREMRERGDDPGVIGLVADLTNPMWEQTVVDPRYRCIIPITHFGNPDGEYGTRTRTWFSVKDQPIMAWAGFCRNFPDVGPCYAGMTMDANPAIPPTNDRMPALLELSELDRWLHGSIQDVIDFQFRAPFAPERMLVLQTDEPWRGGAPPPMAAQLGLL